MCVVGRLPDCVRLCLFNACVFPCLFVHVFLFLCSLIRLVGCLVGIAFFGVLACSFACLVACVIGCSGVCLFILSYV